jgi:acetyl-CoA synthetase
LTCAGTAELESSLAQHPDVVESAVVGMPHAVKGEGIYAYVITKPGTIWGDAETAALKGQIRSDIGAFAVPDIIHHVPGLPKTRSGAWCIFSQVFVFAEAHLVRACGF